ncbi:MAG: c-type cytochrome [Vicinamibacterales bacterium]
MTRQILAAVAAVAFVASTAWAQKIEQTPMKRTAANDGAGMFNAYCASCHGLDATGNGPAAKALAKAPADLTKITARNGGTFPETKIKRYIEGADEIAAHGSRDMPVWSTLFRTMEPATVPLRVQALADFLKSIQK